MTSLTRIRSSQPAEQYAAEPPRLDQDDPRGQGRPSWIEVDLDRLAGNVLAARHLIGERVQLMAVVKANAYGHGASMVARTAVSAGADALAVATVDEGSSLRAFGLSVPILVLGPIAGGEVRRAVAQRLSLAIPDVSTAQAIEREATTQPSDPIPVHVKFDSGMHRFGGDFESALEASQFVARSPKLDFAGVFTHFADADNPGSSYTDQQTEALRHLVAVLKQDGIEPKLVHAANSAGILRDRAHHFDMVRLGIVLYGLPPATGDQLPPGFYPVLSVKSTVAHVLSLAAGDSVSYGRTYIASGPEQAALVPIGYADGLRRALSNHPVMAIAGRRVPIRGRVCMDQTVVGVPASANVSQGDLVDVIGTGESNELSFDEAADALGTLSYELVSALAARLPRYYIQGGQLVAVSDLNGVRRL